VQARYTMGGHWAGMSAILQHTERRWAAPQYGEQSTRWLDDTWVATMWQVEFHIPFARWGTAFINRQLPSTCTKAGPLTAPSQLHRVSC
jgi:hypothetical protein